MNHLVYNISFDIAGLALILSVFAIHIITYRYSSKNNRAFQMFLCASVCDGAMEILTAFTISCAQSVPDPLNMALNTLHTLSACGLAYFGMRYVFSCFRKRLR